MPTRPTRACPATAGRRRAEAAGAVPRWRSGPRGPVRSLDDSVYEVAAGTPAVGRERAGLAGEDAVRAVGHAAQRAVLDHRREPAGGHDVVVVDPDRDDVRLARRQRDRRRELLLLPARAALAGERHRPDLGPGRRPHAADVGAALARALEEADRGQQSGAGDAQL